MFKLYQCFFYEFKDYVKVLLVAKKLSTISTKLASGFYVSAISSWNIDKLKYFLGLQSLYDNILKLRNIQVYQYCVSWKCV